MQEEKSNASILIVDDDEALLQALPQVVHLRMREVQVETADSGPTALQRLQDHDYDAIISDVKMPGMDGIELLSHIHEKRPDTPVVLITGHGDHDLAIKALRGGAYDYILKPIDRDVFVAALHRAIQTRQLRRKVSEQQLALALHAQSLERLVEKRTHELVAVNASKDKFLSIVSQEVHPPLLQLKDMTQLLRQQIERGDAVTTLYQGLLDMQRSIERTDILMQDLLDTSHMETNMFVLNRQRCDLVELTHQLLTAYTKGFGPNLIREVQGEPIEVEIDSDRFKQVLLNLLSNARKFSVRGSPITVTLQQAGYEVILSVRDRGVGIPAEFLPSIFEQYYRVPGIEVQNGARTGLGLGLFITHKIVERHSGHIEVQSMPGEGSIFSIFLPIAANALTEKSTSVPTTPLTQAVWTIADQD